MQKFARMVADSERFAWGMGVTQHTRRETIAACKGALRGAVIEFRRIVGNVVEPISHVAMRVEAFFTDRRRPASKTKNSRKNQLIYSP